MDRSAEKGLKCSDFCDYCPVLNKNIHHKQLFIIGAIQLKRYFLLDDLWTQAAVVGKLYALAKKFSITSYIGNALR